MRLTQLTAALIAAGLALPALAAPPDNATLEKLAARLEKLEARNAELEKEVSELKGESKRVAEGLDSPRLSQYEPELTARLKAVEKDTLGMKKAAALAEKFDGVTVDASLTTVAQRARGLPRGTDNAGTQLNYRADLSVEVPLEPVGDIEQKVFAHVRIGQNQGLNNPFGLLGHFNVPNAAAFHASGANADDSTAILGQAWYQASIPLPFGGFGPHSREKLELTFGKMDLFGFFDQNEAAGDEATQFLNAMFVHNPLLDAGGEVAADGNGFQPGFVASYLNETNKAEAWRLSLGIFGAGERGASYRRGMKEPLAMLQAEKQLKLFGGLTGNYRLYGWNRNNVEQFDGSKARHTGVGLSVDQQFGDGVKLFGRYGQLIKGKMPFEKALALGAEISGNYWGRAGDALGVGGSWLKTGSAYRKAGGEVYLSEDDFNAGISTPFTPRGAEKVAEVY